MAMANADRGELETYMFLSSHIMVNWLNALLVLQPAAHLKEK